MKYEIRKNPNNITYEQMESLFLSCFPGEPYNESYFYEMLQEHFWIVFNENYPIGFSQIKILDCHVHISKIAIMKAYRGNRLGRKLMEAVEIFSSEMGSDIITLSVKVGNTPAISLYGKHGFVNSGEKHQFVIDINEIIKFDEKNSVIAVDRSNHHGSSKYDVEFVLSTGEVIGECQLDTSFPGCSYYSLKRPEEHLKGSLSSLGKYLNSDIEELKIIISDQQLKNKCVDDGHRLNYSLMKMVKTL